jgi:hypothetical protein
MSANMMKMSGERNPIPGRYISGRDVTPGEVPRVPQITKSIKVVNPAAKRRMPVPLTI